MVCSRPLEIFIGLCVFSVAATGGAVDGVASTSLAILLIASFFYCRSWPQSWGQLTNTERLVLFGFALYFLSAVLAYYNVSDEREYVKHLGRYFRFLLIIPVYLLLSRTDLKLFPYLLAGAIVSGPFYLGTAFISLAERPELPAQGGYHHITFGSMVVLNAMLMTAVLFAMRMSKAMKAILVISILCALYASVLSTSRAAWAALPFCLVVLLFESVRHRILNKKWVIISLLVLVSIAVVSPVKDVFEERWQQAVDEIQQFQSGKNFATSVGGRLAMWDVAISVWKEHPVIGTGPGDFDEDLQATQAKGIYSKIDVHSSVHNIYLQALVTTGMFGFLVLCFSLIILPFWLFYRANRGRINVAALGGMITITAFAIFGLSESWILRSPVVAVYLLYFVVLTTTASKAAIRND
jgi:O-antigen ligase